MSLNCLSLFSPRHVLQQSLNLVCHANIPSLLVSYFFTISAGADGGPRSWVCARLAPQILFFCELKSHAKFLNPTITPSGRKVNQQREWREREEKITPLIVDTLFLWKRMQPLGPIINILAANTGIFILPKFGNYCYFAPIFNTIFAYI